MKKLLLPLSIAASLCAFSAVAKSESPYYVTGYAGWYFGEDVTVFGTNLRLNPEFPNDYKGDDGLSLGVGLGYVFSPNWRVQLSYSVRSLEAGGVNTGNSGFAPGTPYQYELDSEHDTDTIMLEAIYDMKVSHGLRPYIKLGVGSTRADNTTRMLSTNDPLFSTFLGPTGLLSADGWYHFPDRSSSHFTWSLGLGLRYALTSNLDIGVEYSHLDMGEHRTGFDQANDAYGYEDAAIDELDLVITYSF